MEDIAYTIVRPDPALSDFIESFWMLANQSDDEKPVIVLPDGRIDLSFDWQRPQHLILQGLDSRPKQGRLAAGAALFVISFRPLGIDYLLGSQSVVLADVVYQLPADYLGVSFSEVGDFEQFCTVFSAILSARLKKPIDLRKKQLFDSLYASDGAIRITELAEKIGWSRRQINRYFNDHFGLSLKTYCDILRFRASFQDLKAGRLFPEQDFADQSHFIREVKKYAGVVPKELAKNKNDRFIQLSTLPPT
ncbi:helix-turn-helix domain-containing protein [Fibrella arboris]|uniref:helix-turn-helix domain-containing protein n=1 Tax=Fibrella arboris TaxID=3242486 RepID=UPI003520FF6E